MSNTKSKAQPNNPELETKFRKCVEYIQKLPPSNPGGYEASANDKLQFYALFKQATDGPNNTKAPSRLNLVAKAKWDAWKVLGQISKEEAMKKYISKVVEISNKMTGKEAEQFRKSIEGTSAKL
mmetsp:Transcript_17557/g.24369  ORF Transcript_17557/g.24369 Transcript_17557/m.24369 type:complete len:124 (+) Transcript_17557:19-390(+)